MFVAGWGGDREIESCEVTLVCVFVQMKVEVVDGQAYVTSVACDAKLGKKVLKAGQRELLPEQSLLTLYAPKEGCDDEDDSEEEVQESQQEERKEEVRVEEKEKETKNELKDDEKEKTDEEDEMEDEKKEEKKPQERQSLATFALLVEDCNPRKMDNYLFYKGKLRSRPDRCLVGDFHRKWRHDFERLEYEHGFIQWLFPLFLGLFHPHNMHDTINTDDVTRAQTVESTGMRASWSTVRHG